MRLGGEKMEDILVGPQNYFANRPSKGTDRAGMCIAQFAARLLCFDYIVENRAGPENHTAYLACPCLALTSEAELDAEPEFVSLLSNGPTAISQYEFAGASAHCSELSALREWLAFIFCCFGPCSLPVLQAKT